MRSWRRYLGVRIVIWSWLARNKMSNLKGRWGNVIKEFKGSEVELVVREALSRIRVKSNSIPDWKWTNDLYSARIDLEFYL